MEGKKIEGREQAKNDEKRRKRERKNTNKEEEKVNMWKKMRWKI